MIEGFKKFLLRGNLIDLAVGVLIGASFGGVVKAFTEGLVMPFIAMFGGAGGKAPNFDTLSFAVNGSVFKYGTFITSLINFVISAAVIYFFVIVPFNKLMERFKREEKPPVAEPTNEEKLLAEIRDVLKARP